MIYLDEYSPLIPEDCRLSEAAPRATQALSSIDRFGLDGYVPDARIHTQM